MRAACIYPSKSMQKTYIHTYVHILNRPDVTMQPFSCRYHCSTVELGRHGHIRAASHAERVQNRTVGCIRQPTHPHLARR